MFLQYVRSLRSASLDDCFILREGTQLRINQSLLELCVEPLGQWTSPIAMIGPGNGAEVSHTLANILNGDVCLGVVAGNVE